MQVNNSHKQINRRKRVLELRCKGLTIPKIKESMTDDGWAISEHTVWDDLHSQTADEFLEELKRQQLLDITACGQDYKTRLQYRGQMIDILTPKKIEQKNEQIGKIVVEVVDPDTPDTESKD